MFEPRHNVLSNVRARTFESKSWRGSNIRARVIGRYPDQRNHGLLAPPSARLRNCRTFQTSFNAHQISAQDTRSTECVGMETWWMADLEGDNHQHLTHPSILRWQMTGNPTAYSLARSSRHNSYLIANHPTDDYLNWPHGGVNAICGRSSPRVSVVELALVWHPCNYSLISSDIRDNRI